ALGAGESRGLPGPRPASQGRHRADRVRPGTLRHARAPSDAAELRRALLLERRHALGVIGGLTHDSHVRGHEVEVRAQVELEALVDEPLDHAYRDLRALGDM